MKSVIKRTLDLVGLEVRKKQSSPDVSNPFDEVFAPVRTNIRQSYDLLKEKGFYPDVVIDVGVADGTPELTQAFGSAYFIWVEPLVEFEGVLKNLLLQHKGEYHLMAAGKEPGTLLLNVHEDLAGSSLLNETDGATADGVSRTIGIEALDTIVRNEFKKNVLLKIDVQGAELDVLEGSKELLKQTEVVVLEVSMFKFQHNSPDFYDVVVYMKQQGFVVYDFLQGHNRPLDKALAQVDMVFVKENGQFRTSHNWATDEQRKTVARLKAEVK